MELEDGFCGSIMENKTNVVEVEGHTVGKDYDFASGKDEGGNGGFSVTWE